MTRRKQRRFVAEIPEVTVFKPQGIPMGMLQEIVLELDEYEAIRLVDLEGLYQDAAAERMGVSRPTLGRILQSAHLKVAEGLIHGKSIVIRAHCEFARIHDRQRPQCCPSRRRAGRCNAAMPPPSCRRTSAGLKNDHTAKESHMIVVSASGTEWDSPVDPRFGRAAYLLLIDPETNTIEAIDNRERANAASGAGVQTAQVVINSKADALITGRLGPKADDILSAAGLEVFMADQCTVREAVDRYLAGK